MVGRLRWVSSSVLFVEKLTHFCSNSCFPGLVPHIQGTTQTRLVLFTDETGVEGRHRRRHREHTKSHQVLDQTVVSILGLFCFEEKNGCELCCR